MKGTLSLPLGICMAMIKDEMQFARLLVGNVKQYNAAKAHLLWPFIFPFVYNMSPYLELLNSSDHNIIVANQLYIICVFSAGFTFCFPNFAVPIFQLNLPLRNMQ